MKNWFHCRRNRVFRAFPERNLQLRDFSVDNLSFDDRLIRRENFNLRAHSFERDGFAIILRPVVRATAL